MRLAAFIAAALIAGAGAPVAMAQGGGAAAQGAGPARGAQPSAATLREVQQQLGKAGYQVAVTGKLDAATRRALSTYQQTRGLKPTGRVDAGTLASLGIIAGHPPGPPATPISSASGTTAPVSGNSRTTVVSGGPALSGVIQQLSFAGGVNAVWALNDSTPVKVVKVAPRSIQAQKHLAEALKKNDVTVGRLRDAFNSKVAADQSLRKALQAAGAKADNVVAVESQPGSRPFVAYVFVPHSSVGGAGSGRAGGR